MGRGARHGEGENRLLTVSSEFRACVPLQVISFLTLEYFFKMSFKNLLFPANYSKSDTGSALDIYKFQFLVQRRPFNFTSFPPPSP